MAVSSILVNAYDGLQLEHEPERARHAALQAAGQLLAALGGLRIAHALIKDHVHRIEVLLQPRVVVGRADVGDAGEPHDGAGVVGRFEFPAGDAQLQRTAPRHAGLEIGSDRRGRRGRNRRFRGGSRSLRERQGDEQGKKEALHGGRGGCGCGQNYSSSGCRGIRPGLTPAAALSPAY